MCIACAIASAQTIGNYVLAPNASTSGLSAPFTVIDLSSAATSSGTIGAVAVRGAQTCTGAFKVKFFHQPSSGVYQMYAERGPFDVVFPINVVQMTPAVSVTAGDLIGLTILSDCASAVGQVPLLFKNIASFAGDVTGTTTISSAAGVIPNFALAVFGAPTSNTDIRTQTIVAAGAAQGAFGSSFKTDIFLSNARTFRSSGRLVYHREETSGATNDPLFPFTVDPHQSLVYPNFVFDKLLTTGKGSIDVYTRMGFEAPTVTARVYDDSSGGTKGFTFDALTDREALQPSEIASLALPNDAARYRVNVGVRTLDGDTRVEYDLYDQNGTLRSSTTKTYPANYYQQTDFNSLFGVSFQPGDTIQVVQQAGRSFVYTSIIDNTSNDPSAQIAKPVK
ncbi:MAG: hypothetical protein DMF56_14510 [Acidobacteria bacterium]|nr:MAG: hypothetical protein DMF56_14510 [Acidobacteriota bacterium]